MSGALNFILPLAAGFFIGAVFFGGLWWTVLKGVTARQPALWFLGSTVVRTAFVLGGFYFAGQGDWRKLLACLLGFLMARGAVALLTRKGEGEAHAA